MALFFFSPLLFFPLYAPIFVPGPSSVDNAMKKCCPIQECLCCVLPGRWEKGAWNPQGKILGLHPHSPHLLCRTSRKYMWSTWHTQNCFLREICQDWCSFQSITSDGCARDIIHFLAEHKGEWIEWKSLQEHVTCGWSLCSKVAEHFLNRALSTQTS